MTKTSSTKILQISSAALGLVGSVFMALGVIGSSPNDIAKLGGLYFGINPNYLFSIAESKANTIIGLMLLSGSFCVQIILHLYEERLPDIYITRKKVLLSIVYFIVSIVIVLYYRHHIIKETTYQTHKEMAYMSLEQQFKYNTVNGPKINDKVLLTEGQVQEIEGHMKSLSFKKKSNELREIFFERYCANLGHEFCNQIDFKKSVNTK